MKNCRFCSHLNHCSRTNYVWLKKERTHGIDTSRCRLDLSLWMRIRILFNRLATWWR
jgi:hypothetical protein